jgi:hypothetical protein
VIREQAPNAQDFTNKRYRHGGVVDEVERGKEPVRAEVEHPFRVLKGVRLRQGALPRVGEETRSGSG